MLSDPAIDPDFYRLLSAAVGTLHQNLAWGIRDNLDDGWCHRATVTCRRSPKLTPFVRVKRASGKSSVVSFCFPMFTTVFSNTFLMSEKMHQKEKFQVWLWVGMDSIASDRRVLKRKHTSSAVKGALVSEVSECSCRVWAVFLSCHW